MTKVSPLEPTAISPRPHQSGAVKDSAVEQQRILFPIQDYGGWDPHDRSLCLVVIMFCIG